MLETDKLVAFIATLDGARARRFYETMLGLQVVSDDDYAIAVDVAGTMLRIQKVDGLTPHPFTALGWQVANIVSRVGELRERGVTFQQFAGMGQDALGVSRSTSGAQVAWFKDPDGNTLSLTQL